MGLPWFRWIAAAAIVVTGSACAAEFRPEFHHSKIWSGQVKPDGAWLERQGVATSYPIHFTIEDSGRVSGTIQFDGGANPAAGGHAKLTGTSGKDGISLAATVEGNRKLPTVVKPKAEVRISLTGYPAADGSLAGVGVLNMADLACLTDPARAQSPNPCPRRQVPIKWTAKN